MEAKEKSVMSLLMQLARFKRGPGCTSPRTPTRTCDTLVIDWHFQGAMQINPVQSCVPCICSECQSVLSNRFVFCPAALILCFRIAPDVTKGALQQATPLLLYYVLFLMSFENLKGFSGSSKYYLEDQKSRICALLFCHKRFRVL